MPNNFEDLTSYECFINDVSIEFYSRLRSLENGMLFAMKIAKELSRLGCKYFIIFSCLNNKDYCVHFHSIHPNEAPWIDIDELDEMREEILVIKN